MKNDRLTRRERQIAVAYADGASYREIAGRLFIAPDTVRTHLRAIYRKLGVASKIQLLKQLQGGTASGPLAHADHGLRSQVGRLREDALFALADGIFDPEQVEPALRASEPQCRAIIEMLPAVVLLKDQALRYVFANRFFLSQWGLCPGHVVGRTQQEVFSGELGFAWSRATDDRDAGVLQTGQGTGFYVVRVPAESARDRVLWARKLPLRDQAGSISRVLTLGIDITPLERMPDPMSARVPSADLPLPPAIAARLPRAQSSARILIVDAKPDVRQLAVAALERLGHTVETAASGREALANLALRRFDLIVSDIGMADLDGPALHQVLAARHPELLQRVIFTAEAPLSEALEDLAVATGAASLRKPFGATDIVARTEARLAGVTGTRRER